jgi:transposase
LPDDWHGLRVQEEPLAQYLLERGMSLPVNLRAVLETLDYSAFTRAYSREGRKALHPRTQLGLIVYGMLKRQWSLRELEALAKCDAGAWLVCGGHQPDHSTMGKFIQLHSEILSEEFFADLVKQLAHQLNLRTGVAAVDGTVIEAAASRFGLLRAEAARAAAEQAQRRAAADPQDATLAQKAQVTQAAARVAEARNARRSEAGLKGEIKVAPAEPEAVYQPRQDGVRCAAYKPSVLVEQSQTEGEEGTVKIQLIVGQGVHPSSEPALFNPLLAQHLRGFGCDPATVLADAGYASLKIFADCYERNLDLLCPSGRTRSDEAWAKRGNHGKFGKPAFAYDPVRDLYRCPAGREVVREQRYNTDRGGRSYARYKGVACRDCALRAQCTKAKGARTLKRYTDEEFKEGMLAVMTQPRARARYRARGAIVERIFAEIRERQGLKRFHRRGLFAVRAEFALHCIAFNLKQAAAGLRLTLIFGIYARLNGSPGLQYCQLVAIIVRPTASPYSDA